MSSSSSTLEESGTPRAMLSRHTLDTPSRRYESTERASSSSFLPVNGVVATSRPSQMMHALFTTLPFPPLLSFDDTTNIGTLPWKAKRQKRVRTAESHTARCRSPWVKGKSRTTSSKKSSASSHAFRVGAVLTSFIGSSSSR